MEVQTVSHTLYTKPSILSVCPPVVAVPWGATIIQPSVVKTESDVMTTVKQPLLASDTLHQSTCHAEAMHNPSHTSHKGLLCYLVNDTTHTGKGSSTQYCTCYHNCYTREYMSSTANSNLLRDIPQ